MASSPPLPKPDTRWALFLDVDGTLLDIAPTPDSVLVPDALKASLASVHTALAGGLALVSGRPVAELDSLFAPHRFACAGIHGAEIRMAPAAPVVITTGDVPHDLMARVAAIVARHPGLRLEPKGRAVAVHFRDCPAAPEGLEPALHAALAPFADTLTLMGGRDVWEIKPRGVDKGTAVETLLAVPPFLGRIPVFVGDDVTDEDGFAAARRLGGHALTVYRPDANRAFDNFTSPAAVRAWLAQLPASIRAEG